MTNKNDYQSHNREVQQDSYKDANGHIHTNVKKTEETINNVPVGSNSNSYRNGYVDAQENLADRDNSNAASGLLVGLLLASLVGLVGGVLFFLNQRNDTPTPITPAIVVPQKPEAKQPPEKETTIIEKTRDVLVPVPQQQAPVPQAPVAPPQQDINISIPNPAPTQVNQQPAPSIPEVPKQSESQSNSTSTQEKNNDTSISTPAQNKSNQTDTLSGSSSDKTGANSTENSAQ
ncbi:hypothetical protein FNW02_24650 [Komarekiella sp. 'clone 1']|uniref:Uncharacterized protein n=1 Tax=Komarekiella delphini-convector SJRDD-AB1 TaxID=2593771 RepID=A0AA40T1J9_9NOST|nr:hypothetical protein [Komarekiella delphini-convector]MBD6618925.1 hypothetical protein [Komarekiella delphini-convector SJRDD-AB1]